MTSPISSSTSPSGVDTTTPTAAGPGLPRAPPSTWTTSFIERERLVVLSDHSTDVGRGELARNPGTAAVANLAVAGVLGVACGGAAAVALAAVDDDLHVGVVLVVLRELVVELVRELLWDDAIDHRSDINRGACRRIPCPSGAPDPSASAVVNPRAPAHRARRPPRWHPGPRAGAQPAHSPAPPRAPRSAPRPGRPRSGTSTAPRRPRSRRCCPRRRAERSRPARPASAPRRRPCADGRWR